MRHKSGTDRRDFLRSVALAGGVAASADIALAQTAAAPSPNALDAGEISHPRIFTGPALAMISFPLGGVGAGSIGLGGRGQLRDWEIFNRPDKGNSPAYAFPAIWVQTEGQKPVARVLEARIETPYEGQDGLGSRNAPGLSRLESATFTGEFPLAQIDFHDASLPVDISLEAGTPFIPLDPDESGLPVAILRYRVRNKGTSAATVSIAFSIENPVKAAEPDTRINVPQTNAAMQGLLMKNPALAAGDPGNGTFALAVLTSGSGHTTSDHTTMLRGWPAGRWWNSPLLFWDDFSSDGELGPEADKVGPVGAVCLKRTIAAGVEAEYTFLLAWHFPNRTPERCGWQAPKGHQKDVIGNWYTTRFADAWAAIEYAASKLDNLQERTRRFARAIRETTLPDVVKEAATANLSTLVSTTCFRTADGEFHGFEGVDDHLGCCFGNCTHVWNYETATAHLFPSFSRSLRRGAFGYSMDERGAMYFRQLLPDGLERSGFAAADGQMGQIIKVYIDWQLSGDDAFLREFWPKAKRALEFAWIPGGWDADRDGVLEGVQHNTYDVEFYGPNPLCGIYYLGALRAGEEMARAVGDSKSADEYRRLFENGSHWIDANLFNGEYYVQKIRGRTPGEIAPGLRSGMGADDPEHPQYQLGDGCLADQLLGQYLADVAGLGPLLKPANIRKTLESIYRYNHKPDLYDHDCVQRTYVLNDEAALLVCDYGKGERPVIPFPYYAEAWTGLEYTAAALMFSHGLAGCGYECVANVRARYDGVRRNPWDEPECGHHYARAMSSWSGMLALSGFRYRGSDRLVSVAPRANLAQFRSFWSSGTGWGMFSLTRDGLSLSVIEGFLQVRRIELPVPAGATSSVVTLGAARLNHLGRRGNNLAITLSDELELQPGQDLVIEIR
jgi:non-lysosomal glucosylceramidase